MAYFDKDFQEKIETINTPADKIPRKDKKELILRYLNIFFYLLALLGLLSFLYNLVEIYNTNFFSIESIKSLFPGMILVFISSFFISILKNFESFYLSFGKTLIKLSAFSFSIFIVLFVFNQEAPKITNNIQVTIDNVLINYIDGENSPEMEIFKSMIENPVEIQEFQVNSLTQTQKDYLIEIFATEDMTQEQLERLPGVIITATYQALSTQGEEYLESPLPIRELKTMFEDLGDYDLAILSLLSFIEINENASVYIIVELENKNNYSLVQNLNSIRNQCEKLEENEVCNAILITKFENLIEYLGEENNLVGFDLDPQVLQDYSTPKKIEKQIEEKTSIYFFFLNLSIFLLLLGIFLINKYYSSDVLENPLLKTLEVCFKVLFFHFLFPTILITLIFILLKSGILFDLFENLLNIFSLEQNFSIDISTIPIIENLVNILTRIFYINILITSMFLLFFLVFHRLTSKPNLRSVFN